MEGRVHDLRKVCMFILKQFGYKIPSNQGDARSKIEVFCIKSMIIVFVIYGIISIFVLKDNTMQAHFITFVLSALLVFQTMVSLIYKSEMFYNSFEEKTKDMDPFHIPEKPEVTVYQRRLFLCAIPIITSLFSCGTMLLMEKDAPTIIHTFFFVFNMLLLIIPIMDGIIEQIVFWYSATEI